jgi:hypothetical protein
LTRDQTWINYPDMVSKFRRLPDALPNAEQRAQVNDYADRFRRDRGHSGNDYGQELLTVRAVCPAGNAYGRVIGIIAGSLGAIGALFSIGDGNPWWSLCMFFLCIYVVYGIIAFAEDKTAVEGGI